MSIYVTPPVFGCPLSIHKCLWTLRYASEREDVLRHTRLQEGLTFTCFRVSEWQVQNRQALDFPWSQSSFQAGNWNNRRLSCNRGRANWKISAGHWANLTKEEGFGTTLDFVEFLGAKTILPRSTCAFNHLLVIFIILHDHWSVLHLQVLCSLLSVTRSIHSIQEFAGAIEGRRRGTFLSPWHKPWNSTGDLAWRFFREIGKLERCLDVLTRKSQPHEATSSKQLTPFRISFLDYNCFSAWVCLVCVFPCCLKTLSFVLIWPDPISWYFKIFNMTSFSLVWDESLTSWPDPQAVFLRKVPLEQVITLLKIPCFGLLHSNDSQIPRYLVSATSLYCFSRFWVEHRTSSDELNFSQDCCMIFQHAWIGSLWFWAAGVSYPLVERLPTRMDISSVSCPLYVYIYFIYQRIKLNWWQNEGWESQERVGICDDTVMCSQQVVSKAR